MNCSIRLHHKVLAVLVVAVLTGIANQPSRADSFVAFSLQQAQARMERGRNPVPEIVTIGGITDPLAVVYDRDTKDLILVGKAESKGHAVTLDDFVIALRAILKHQVWPLVSIDKSESPADPKKQTIRFEGGIEDSAFGKDLLEADILLKNIGLDERGANTRGVKSYFEMLCERTAAAGVRKPVRSRFWFVGDEAASALVDREGVMVINNLAIAVETRVDRPRLSQSDSQGEAQDDIGNAFARAVSISYSNLAQRHPVLERASRLFKLVALATGVRTLSTKYTSFSPELDFWLDTYNVARVETPTECPLIAKEKIIEHGQGTAKVEVDGGIELKALLLELRDGVPTALRDIVIKYRPSPSALSWQVPLKDWRVLRPDAKAGTLLDAGLHGKAGKEPGFTLDAVVSPLQSSRIPATTSTYTSHSISVLTTLELDRSVRPADTRVESRINVPPNEIAPASPSAYERGGASSRIVAPPYTPPTVQRPGDFHVESRLDVLRNKSDIAAPDTYEKGFATPKMAMPAYIPPKGEKSEIIRVEPMIPVPGNEIVAPLPRTYEGTFAPPLNVPTPYTPARVEDPVDRRNQDFTPMKDSRPMLGETKLSRDEIINRTLDLYEAPFAPRPNRQWARPSAADPTWKATESIRPSSITPDWKGDRVELNWPMRSDPYIFNSPTERINTYTPSMAVPVTPVAPAPMERFDRFNPPMAVPIAPPMPMPRNDFPHY